MKVLVIAIALLAAGCAAKKTQVVTGPTTNGDFVPAPGLFAERDVQYVGSVPHCIVRLSKAKQPESFASYAEVPLDWCEGAQ